MIEINDKPAAATKAATNDEVAIFKREMKPFLLTILPDLVIPKIERLSEAMPPGERRNTKADAYELSYVMIEQMSRFIDVSEDAQQMLGRTKEEKDGSISVNSDFFIKMLEQMAMETIIYARGVLNLTSALIHILADLTKLYEKKRKSNRFNDDDYPFGESCYESHPLHNIVALRNKINNLANQFK